MNGKIKIQVGNGIKFFNLPEKAVIKLKKDLTFENKQYKDAIKFGKYISSSIPEFFRYYAISSNKKVIWTPRGYIWIMKKWLNDNNYEVIVEDKTLLLPKINVKFYGKLRDYQEKAVNDIIGRYPIGVLEANTGSGKTCMAIAVIAERKQPTLIIVHTKELLYQWQDAIKFFLHYDCGLIGDGKFEVKDITVGIINTVKNKTDILEKKFGQIICDEVHRVSSSTWSDTLLEFPAKHYLGLSATTFRNDGLSNAIFVHVGPKVHTVSKEMLYKTGKVLKPQIILVKTNFRAARSFIEEDQMAYSKVIKKLTEDPERNELIANIIYQDLRKYNEHILVVSDRVSHCKEISRLLNSININNSVLTGKTPIKEREKIVKEARKGKSKVLIATLSLIGEGFSLNSLACLCLTTPVTYKGRVVQAIGRILRPAKNKIPRVIDVRDDNVKVLRNSGFKRNKIYKEHFGG